MISKAYKIKKFTLVTVTLFFLIILFSLVLTYLYSPATPIGFETPTSAKDTWPKLKINFAKQIQNMGPIAAYNEFKKVYQNQSISNQHNAAHIFGELLYDQQGVSASFVWDS
jgi:hypothetical protein